MFSVCMHATQQLILNARNGLYFYEYKCKRVQNAHKRIWQFLETQYFMRLREKQILLENIERRVVLMKYFSKAIIPTKMYGSFVINDLMVITSLGQWFSTKNIKFACSNGHFTMNKWCRYPLSFLNIYTNMHKYN